MASDAGPKVGRAVAGALRVAGYPVVSARIYLAIDAMTCASGVARVESVLQAVPAVLTATVNPADNTASVSTLSRDDAAFVAAVKAAGCGQPRGS